MQLEFVEAENCADVLETLTAFVTQQPEFRAIPHIHQGGQIEPTVVIKVDGGHSPASLRLKRKLNFLEAGTVHVPP